MLFRERWDDAVGVRGRRIVDSPRGLDALLSTTSGRGLVRSERSHWLRIIWRFFSVDHVAITGKVSCSLAVARWLWQLLAVHSSCRAQVRCVLQCRSACESANWWWCAFIVVFDVVLDVRGVLNMYSAPTRHPTAGVSKHNLTLSVFFVPQQRAV